MSPDRKKTEKESRSNASEKGEGRGEQTAGRVSGEPLTINLLISEQLKPGPGSVIARQDIVQVRYKDFEIHSWPHLSLLQAIEESPRPINKKAVLRDLETILAQEIHLGYLVKVT